MRPATEIIHGSTGGNRDADPLTTPIYETTTFLFENAAEVKAFNEGKSNKFLYSRYGNPTTAAAERTIAKLEGAESAALFASGMAATSTALLALLTSGDEVVCSAAIYGGTFHLIADLFLHFGIKARFATLEELAHPDRLIGDRTKVVWFESPINPTLRCVDVAAIAAACRARKVTSIIDNTFASPLNQQPIALGVDIVMESVTKSLNGHSDVTAGALAGPARLMADIEKTKRLLGGMVDPQAAYAIGRGMKTLSVRMERHNANGLAVARWLESPVGKRVETVYYPDLESHPDHALAKHQMAIEFDKSPILIRQHADLQYAIFSRPSSACSVQSKMVRGSASGRAQAAEDGPERKDDGHWHLERFPEAVITVRGAYDERAHEEERCNDADDGGDHPGCDADEGPAQDAAVVPPGTRAAHGVNRHCRVGGPGGADIVVVGRHVDVGGVADDKECTEREAPPPCRPPQEHQNLADVPGICAGVAAAGGLDVAIFLEEVTRDARAMPARRHPHQRRP